MNTSDCNRTICVIGAGPAGLSSALWLKQMGFSPVILEKGEKLGGLQTVNKNQNDWYLGVPGRIGTDFIKEFVAHIEGENLDILLNTTVGQIRRQGDYVHISTTSGREILARAIVICAGQHIRKYDYLQSIEDSHLLNDFERVFFNPSVIASQVAVFKGQQVAVVGGGDNALLAAAQVAKVAQRVHFIVRSSIHGFGLYQQAVVEAIQSGQVILHRPAQIKRVAIRGNQVDTTLQDNAGNVKTLTLDALCFQIGFSPNGQAIRQLLQDGGLGTLACTATGHVKVDPFCRTSIARIYAAGDIANLRDPCVATAVGQGAIVARSVEEDLRTLIWKTIMDSHMTIST